MVHADDVIFGGMQRPERLETGAVGDQPVRQAAPEEAMPLIEIETSEACGGAQDTRRCPGGRFG